MWSFSDHLKQKLEKKQTGYAKGLKFKDISQTHKFHDLDEKQVTKLKFKQMTDNTGVAKYNAAKLIDEYLKTMRLEII